MPGLESDLPGETMSLATAIGERVRAERLSRQWTLDDLANAASVSRRMIVSVEKGSVNPSVGLLLRISEALGIPLPSLVEPPSQLPFSVTRQGEEAVLWTSESGGTGALETSTAGPDVVELWHWMLMPGDRHASDAHPPGAQELLHVLSGRVLIEIGERSIELGTGDSLSFRADAAHAYRNSDDEPARFMLAVFDPGVRPRRRTTDE